MMDLTSVMVESGRRLLSVVSLVGKVGKPLSRDIVSHKLIECAFRWLEIEAGVSYTLQ